MSAQLLRQTLLQLIMLFLVSGVNAQSLVDAAEVSVPKYALVIGNRDYRSYPGVSPAVNDADLIAKQLRALHFDVIVRTNAGYDDIVREVQDLKKRAEQSASQDVRPVAVVYFSGHGFVLSGRQFIAGVDAGKTRAKDPTYESAAIEFMIDQLAEESALIGLLDACRSDLALDRKMAVNAAVPDDPSDGQASSDVGLGSFRRPVVPKPREYLFGFANKFGVPVASGNNGDPNSPYTKTLSHFLGDDENIIEQLESVQDEMQRVMPSFHPDVSLDMSRAIFLNYSDAVLARMREDWKEATRAPSDASMRKFVKKYGNSPLTYRALQWLRQSESTSK
ncbi:caspase domain-containing protein [Bradyrhizobium sp. LLZ17]|uniref:Caspase domain-containing protein n=1 Tax=Bradyrhizobium sp. LLZ17 TaxID=3239388 RepID=A0AB39XGL5_9BRAD